MKQVHATHGGLILLEAGQWREILALATAMGGRGITPHSMTCNAVLKVDYREGMIGWSYPLLMVEEMPVEVGKYMIYPHYLEFFYIHMVGWCRISEATTVCCWLESSFFWGMNMGKIVYPWPIDPSMRPEFDDGM